MVKNSIVNIHVKQCQATRRTGTSTPRVPFCRKKTSLFKIEAEYLDLHELAIKYKDKVRQHAIPICWYMFPVGGKHASKTWVKKIGSSDGSYTESAASMARGDPLPEAITKIFSKPSRNVPSSCDSPCNRCNQDNAWHYHKQLHHHHRHRHHRRHRHQLLDHHQGEGTGHSRERWVIEDL